MSVLSLPRRLLLLLLLLLAGLVDGQRLVLPTPPQPRFLHQQLSSNVTVQLGSTAYLHCRIAGLRDQSVAWYKKVGEGIQLITIGFHTYHNDDRFSMTYGHPHDWKLRINYVQRRDEGTYQCQVSSHPPLTRTLHLHVVEATIQILDERGVSLREKFYRPGSTIQLQCLVTDVPLGPAFTLAWYRDRRRLNYDTARGGVSVKTELRGGVAHSWLLVGGAKLSDSGLYSCNLTHIAAASVAIHVVPDKFPAAIQSAPRIFPRPSLAFLLAVVSCLLIPLLSSPFHLLPRLGDR